MVQEASSDIVGIDFVAVVAYLTTPLFSEENGRTCLPADMAFLQDGDDGSTLATSVIQSHKCVPADFIMRLFIELLTRGDTELLLTRVSRANVGSGSVYQLLLKRTEEIDAFSATKTGLEEQFCVAVKRVRIQVLRLIGTRLEARDEQGFARTSRLALQASIFDIQCLYTLVFKYADTVPETATEPDDVSAYLCVLLSFRNLALPATVPKCRPLLLLVETEMKYRQMATDG